MAGGHTPAVAPPTLALAIRHGPRRQALDSILPRQLLGPPFRMLRSVGMGGTASPLLWNLCYDIIIAAAASVTGAPCPTYVDDLASLLSAAAQALRISIFLPWASWAAGLQIYCHGGRLPPDLRVPHEGASRAVSRSRPTADPRPRRPRRVCGARSALCPVQIEMCVVRIESERAAGCELQGLGNLFYL